MTRRGVPWNRESCPRCGNSTEWTWGYGRPGQAYRRCLPCKRRSVREAPSSRAEVRGRRKYG